MNTSRRTFLKGLLGGGVSVLLDRHLPKPQVKEEIFEEAVGELLQVQPGGATGFAYYAPGWAEDL